MSLSNLKKGDTVILHMFTGIAVGVKEVLAADKSTVTLETRVGRAKFSRKTGKQIEPPAKQERFANFITEDDGSYEPVDRPKKKPAAKKAKAKPKKEEVEPDEDDEEEEETRPVKKSKGKKPAAKKSKKAPEPEPDDDEDLDDEYEDVEEDEE